MEYPDTLYPKERIHWGIIPPDTIVVIKSYDKRDYPFSFNPILQVFIYNKTTMNTIPWDSVRSQSHPLRRYEVTREWMEEHDWTITYP